jgi:L-ascorbate metabolism protein UlaG (beta-lactamase superfamily)
MPKVRFLGHAAVYLEGSGIHALIDPFLTGNPVAFEEADRFEGIDWIFLTHGHGDHLGDAVSIARRTGAVLVACTELTAALGGEGIRTFGMHIGGRCRFPFGRVKMVPAWHGGGIDSAAKGPRLYGGTPCGFLLEIDGKKLYHAGDTGLTVEMTLLAQEGVDLAFLPIGGRYVMDVEDAARAVSMICPRVVVPMHYDTFPEIEANPREFARLVGNAARVEILSPGGEVEF